jgi:hypothetical protein
MRSLSSSKPKLIGGRVAAIDGFEWKVVCIPWVDGRVERHLARRGSVCVLLDAVYADTVVEVLWVVAVVTEESYLLIGHPPGGNVRVT